MTHSSPVRGLLESDIFDWQVLRVSQWLQWLYTERPKISHVVGRRCTVYLDHLAVAVALSIPKLGL